MIEEHRKVGLSMIGLLRLNEDYHGDQEFPTNQPIKWNKTSFSDGGSLS
jgi:hypothetical protein